MVCVPSQSSSPAELDVKLWDSAGQYDQKWISRYFSKNSFTVYDGIFFHACSGVHSIFYWLREELLAPVRLKRRHICCKVKAALCRPVCLKGRFNIPSFPKSTTGVGINMRCEVGREQWRTTYTSEEMWRHLTDLLNYRPVVHILTSSVKHMLMLNPRY